MRILNTRAVAGVLVKALLWIAAYFFIVAIGGCAHTQKIQPDPTPSHPIIACIADAPLEGGDGPAYRKFQKKNMQARGQRVTLPEIVRLIGVTSFEDGSRWMVMRGVYFAEHCSGENLYDRSLCDWQPWPKEKIQLKGCGAEAQALKEMQGFRGADQ